MKRTAVEEGEGLLGCMIEKKKRNIFVGSLKSEDMTVREFITKAVDEYLAEKENSLRKC